MRDSLPAKVARSIREDFIENGKVKPGERLPSVRELKERYMTTNTTICSALSVLENEGVVRKFHGKGNYVQDPEESRKRKESHLFGVIMPQTLGGASMIMQISIGIERAAREAGYQFLLASTNEDYEEENLDIERMIAAGCEGVIMVPMPRLRDQLRHDYLNEDFQDFPIVLVDMAFPEQRRSQVVPDNYQAGVEVTHWLIEEGHRRIAFMDWQVPNGQLLSRSVRDRYRGYLAAMKADGLTPHPDDIWPVTYPGYGVDPHADALAHMERWQGSKERPTALVTFNDNWAVAMINYLMERGARVPEDMRVAGFDNCPTLSQFRPSFPTTDPHFEDLGATAVQLLLQHIRGEIEGPVHYMRPVTLMPRGEFMSRAEAAEQPVSR